MKATRASTRAWHLVAGTPGRGVVVQRARELVDFARSQGYRVDELVEIIEEVG
jgi:hypothetical protein